MNRASPKKPKAIPAPATKAGNQNRQLNPGSSSSSLLQTETAVADNFRKHHYHHWHSPDRTCCLQLKIVDKTNKGY